MKISTIILMLFIPIATFAQSELKRETLFNDSWKFYRGGAQSAQSPLA